MKILILNGSLRPSGNTAAMVAAFSDGAREAGHDVTVADTVRATAPSISNRKAGWRR